MIWRKKWRPIYPFLRRRDVDSLRTQFLTEQDAILDLLIQLQREDEHYKAHVPLETILTEQYYNVIAVSDAMCDNTLPPLNTSTTGTKDRSHIQLPKIQIPSFDGDILRWITFRDTFKSLVHDNEDITKIEKFHYLLSAVTGSASAVVRSILLTDANYEIAWNALEERSTTSA